MLFIYFHGSFLHNCYAEHAMSLDMGRMLESLSHTCSPSDRRANAIALRGGRSAGTDVHEADMFWVEDGEKTQELLRLLECFNFSDTFLRKISTARTSARAISVADKAVGASVDRALIAARLALAKGATDDWVRRALARFRIVVVNAVRAGDDWRLLERQLDAPPGAPMRASTVDELVARVAAGDGRPTVLFGLSVVKKENTSWAVAERVLRASPLARPFDAVALAEHLYGASASPIRRLLDAPAVASLFDDGSEGEGDGGSGRGRPAAAHPPDVPVEHASLLDDEETKSKMLAAAPDARAKLALLLPWGGRYTYVAQALALRLVAWHTAFGAPAEPGGGCGGDSELDSETSY